MSKAFSDRWVFLRDHLNMQAATGVDGAVWEGFQTALLNDDGIFRIEVKSRQIAWSWTIAAEAVAEAVLTDQSSVFVSINQSESAEKVRYAKLVFENLAIGGLPKPIRDSTYSLEFDNGARIISLPAKPPRGKARMNVYLDEYAHVQYDRDIYQAALPIISKGGRLRIGSSPLGAAGMFWEVFAEPMRRYPGYVRATTPWWAVFSFCTDVAAARTVAPPLLTAERVARFGNARIRAIFENMPLEDFQCEYEALFVEENTAVFTWDEIRQMQAAGEGQACCMAGGRGKDLGRVFDALSEIKQAIRAGKMEPVLAGGMDIGRTRDTTEIYLVGQATTGQLPLRAGLSLEACEYEDQRTVLTAVLTQLPVSRLLIDQTGLGNNLAEALSKTFPSKAQGVTFTGPAKQLWVTDGKMLCQQRKLALPTDRDLAYQLHSLKRIVTASKQLVFDSDRNEKHHADRAWAWLLALAASRTEVAAVATARGRTVTAKKLGLE